MGEWRYYAQRINTGLWLDNDAQLSDVDLDWALSGPASGSAYIPSGMVKTPYASDGRLMWEKLGTFLFAEEDGGLAWVGICLGVNPDDKGSKIEFMGITGWFQRIPYNAVLRTWEMDVFEVIRVLLKHSKSYEPGIDFIITDDDSGYTVGDPQPPDRPKEPTRRKGETKADFAKSERYKDWVKDAKEWDKAYGDRTQYELVWWEAPLVGEEIDTLAKEHNFDYREVVRWSNRSKKTYEFTLDVSTDMIRRRDDIAFIDGLNLAAPLETKDIDDDFANHVIALGKGEGRAMSRVQVGEDDGRLYQVEYVTYKSVKDVDRLRRLANRDHTRLSNTNPTIDSVLVWDVEGWASIASLRCGDEVRVVSEETLPPTDVWRRIVGISRNPVESVVALELEAS